MLGLRLPELLIILVVVVLMFGAKKLPELGESLGKGIRAFKKAADHGLVGGDEPPPAGPKQEIPASSASAPEGPRGDKPA